MGTPAYKVVEPRDLRNLEPPTRTLLVETYIIPGTLNPNSMAFLLQATESKLQVTDH